MKIIQQKKIQNLQKSQKSKKSKKFSKKFKLNLQKIQKNLIKKPKKSKEKKTLNNEEGHSVNDINKYWITTVFVEQPRCANDIMFIEHKSTPKP